VTNRAPYCLRKAAVCTRTKTGVPNAERIVDYPEGTRLALRDRERKAGLCPLDLYENCGGHLNIGLIDNFPLAVLPCLHRLEDSMSNNNIYTNQSFHAE
jgi:hypothetical protein